jgi:O-antigen/teichoic acid export membrane protein
MINVPFNAMYTAKQYIAELTIYSFIQTTANAGFIYFMVTHPGDWLAKYALWMCVLAVVPQIIICLRAVKIFPECQFNLKYAWNRVFIKQLTSYALWYAFGCVGGISRGQGIQILINKYFGPSINASMSIANQVSAQTQTLASALQGAFSPAITTACGAGEYDKMRSLAFRTCKFGMLLGLIFILPLSLELDEILRIWLKKPPLYTKELCWPILAAALIDKSTSGHMLAVSAKGKIAVYQAFLGTVLILTLPVAWIFIKFGCGAVSIGWGILLCTSVCALGRVWFARSLVDMSARHWFFKFLCPVLMIILITGLFGYSTRFFMDSGLFRILVTTSLCGLVLLPLSWFILLDVSERQFLVDKIKSKKR